MRVRLPEFTLLSPQWLLLLLLLTWQQGYCQTAPAWQSVVNCDGNSTTTATALDGQGNLYIAGYYSYSMRFGTITLPNSNNQQGFLAKWNTTTSQFEWAQVFAGTASRITALAVSGGNVYLGGEFSGLTVRVGTGASSMVLNNTGGTSVVSTNCFVARFTPAGTLTWVQQIGGTSNNRLKSIAVSGSAVYVTGSVYWSTQFGPFLLTTSSADNTYLACLTDAGSSASFAWVWQDQTPGMDTMGTAIAVQGTSIYLVTGKNQSTSNGAYTEMAARKFMATATGAQPVWQQTLGGTGGKTAPVCVLSGSDLYLGGGFMGTSLQVGTETLANTGPATTFDAYVLRLTDLGTSARVAWLKGGAGSADEYVNHLAIQGNELIAVGDFNGTTGTFGTTTLTNSSTVMGGTDSFVSKLATATGAFAWTQQVRGIYNDRAATVTADATNIYVTGYLNQATQFGSAPITPPLASGVLSGGSYVALLPNAQALGNRAATGANSLAISTYPNPAADYLTVSIPAVAGVEQATLALYDMQGRVVRRQAVDMLSATTFYRLSVRDLRSGLYMLQVEAGTAASTQQIEVVR